MSSTGRENGIDLEDMVLFCVHCVDANLSNEASKGTIEEVYGHWLSGHTDLANVKPFWFYVSFSIECFHCGTVCNYHEMTVHHNDCHQDETFAVVTPTNRRQCALCDYVGDEMVEHFTVEHEDLFHSQIFNPGRISEGLLDKLFGIDIHKKRQCGQCDVILETQHEMEAHHSSEHSGEMISNEYFNRKSA